MHLDLLLGPSAREHPSRPGSSVLANSAVRLFPSEAPVPHYLLPGSVARRDIAANVVVTGAMIEAPADSTLWRLRAEQDTLFGL